MEAFYIFMKVSVSLKYGTEKNVGFFFFFFFFKKIFKKKNNFF